MPWADGNKILDGDALEQPEDLGPLPSVEVAQRAFVNWATRHHWLRKQLTAKRAEGWRRQSPHSQMIFNRDVVDEYALELDYLSWLTAEAEHGMVYYRNVLHALGEQPA